MTTIHREPIDAVNLEHKPDEVLNIKCFNFDGKPVWPVAILPLRYTTFISFQPKFTGTIEATVSPDPLNLMVKVMLPFSYE